uniref:ATP-dependent DNA helicase n=1 Tax=Lactuca sativa TaxID=4236 RepID=A0A9R1WKU9_LACSA|nr:hypothetical protein LSAT_V11C100016290 [Lactuca sativa]
MNSTFCCMSGKTKLAYSPIPTELHQLFTRQEQLEESFRYNIRAYNSNFSFESMGVKVDEKLANMTSGVYSFCEHGTLYHNIKSTSKKAEILPTCFEDLYTANDVLHPTFRKAALERGLIETDDNSSKFLVEASLFQFPSALRRLFATMLIFCEPGNVRKLSDDRYDSLSKDYRKQYGCAKQVQNMALIDIRVFLESMSKKLSDYHLLNVSAHIDLQSRGYREVQEEYSINVEYEDLHVRDSLNPDQKFAYDEITRHVDENILGVFFIDGLSGTGKKFLYKALLANIRVRGLIALAIATSGVAANNMPGGRIAHSRFGIPIILDNNLMCKIIKQSEKAHLLHEAKVIIWDEAAVAKRQTVAAADRTMQDITDEKLPFDGKIMVMGEIVVGQHAGKRVFLPIIPLCPSDDEMFPFKLKRKQFPIQLSFSMTINKAQGQTIPNVGVYLPESVFSHGQLYVTLSRGISRVNTKSLASDGTIHQSSCTDTPQQNGVAKLKHRHIVETTCSLLICSSAGRILLSLYVDDMIIMGDDHGSIESLKHDLAYRFAMKDLGLLFYFLGIKVAQSKKGYLLSQTKYIFDLFTRASLSDNQTVDAPLETNARYSHTDGVPFSDPNLYHTIVESLVYLTVIRPDIAHVVHVVSQFVTAPTSVYWGAVLHILRYLRDTQFQTLLFPSTSSL